MSYATSAKIRGSVKLQCCMIFLPEEYISTNSLTAYFIQILQSLAKTTWLCCSRCVINADIKKVSVAGFDFSLSMLLMLVTFSYEKFYYEAAYSVYYWCYIVITPKAIEQIKLFKPMLTLVECLSMQCYTYLIYIRTEYKLQERDKRLLGIVFTDSISEICTNGSSNAVHTFELSCLNFPGRKYSVVNYLPTYCHFVFKSVLKPNCK